MPFISNSEYRKNVIIQVLFSINAVSCNRKECFGVCPHSENGTKKVVSGTV